MLTRLTLGHKIRLCAAQSNCYLVETIQVSANIIFVTRVNNFLIIFQRSSLKYFPIIKKIGYNINVLQQTECLVVNTITVGNFAFLFNCTPAGRTSDSMMVPT